MPRLLALVAAFVAALLLAAPAHAADVLLFGSTLTVSTDAVDPDTTVTVQRTSLTQVVVTQSAGAPLSGNAGCTVAADTATCTVPGDVVLSADLMGDPGDRRTLTVLGDLRGEVLSGGAGDDTITGGNLNDTIYGFQGDDVLRGGESPTTPDYLSGGEGDDVLDGENGNDRMSGGPGGDIIRDTSTQETVDVAEYFSRPGSEDDFRTTGVTVTLDGVRNDGSAEDGPLRDNVETTVTSITGTELADHLTGGSGPNRLLGYAGDDVLVGLGGADELSGQLGSDTLDARDGEKDANIDCNNSDLSRGTGPNTAVIDGALETANDCSNVDTGLPSGGGTPGGSGGSPSGPGGSGGNATTPGGGGGVLTAFPKPRAAIFEPFPARTIKMPDFTRGSRDCKQRWCKAETVKSRLDRLGINARYEIKEATAKALETAASRDVEIGEVLYTDPKARETITSSSAQQVKIRIYEFAPKTLDGCNLERPFVRVAKRLYRLTDYLKDISPRRAEEILEDLGCARAKWEVVDKQSTRAKDVSVTGVRLVGAGTKRRIELTVTSPPPRLRLYDVNPRQGDKLLPPVFSSKGELALPDQPFRMAIRPLTDAGVGFTKVDVVLRDRSGVWVAGNVTNADGVAGFGRMEPLKPGNYALWAYACDAGGDCVVGTRDVSVIKLRKDRQYLGLDGRTWAASGDRFAPRAASAAGATARAAQASSEVEAQKAKLGQVLGQIVTKAATSPLFIQAQRAQPAGEVAKAVQTLNAAAGKAGARGFAGYYDALIAAGAEVNAIGGTGGVTSIGPGAIVRKTGVVSDGRTAVTVPTSAIDVGGGTLTLKVGRVLIVPGGMFYVVDGGGKAIGTPNRVKVDVSSPKFELTPLNGAMAVGMGGTGGRATLVGTDGASLIGTDGASLIGMDGSTLVGMDGGTLVGLDGGSLVGTDGGSLIGMDGGSLVAAGAGN